MALGQVLAGIWLAVSALLALEGAYYLWATFASRRPAPLPAPVALDDPPRVLVQVPVKDEGDVLSRALDAVAALDWPREGLDVQVVDDSAPEGYAASARLVEAARARGLRVTHFRGEPADHKAGALRAGLARSDAPLVCILDADFAPPPSFLREAAARLLADERLACVQARWSTDNERASWCAPAVALALDAHFLVEQRARAHAGGLLSFIGTGALWRREAIDEAGGWSGRTLAEDVDLGALALVRGRRFGLLETPPVPQHVPERVGAFRSQQARWARGSMQCARLHAGRVARAGALPWSVRAETLFHLTHYAVHPLLFALFVLQLARPFMAPVPPLASVLLLGFALAGGAAPFVATAWRTGSLARLRHVPLLTLLGLGISWSNTRAVAAGLLGPRGVFVRTPKGQARGSRGVRLDELVFGVGGVLGAWALALDGFLAAAVGAAVFGASFLLVALAR